MQNLFMQWMLILLEYYSQVIAVVNERLKIYHLLIIAQLFIYIIL